MIILPFGFRKQAAAAATEYTTEIDSILGSGASIGSDKMCGLRIDMPATGTITKLTAYLNDSGAAGLNCKPALYSHGGDNRPLNLLHVGPETAIPDSFSWVDLEFSTGYEVTSGTTIWLCFLCEGTIAFKYQLSAWADNAFLYNGVMSYASPTTFVSSGNRYDDGGLSIYATYTT